MYTNFIHLVPNRFKGIIQMIDIRIQIVINTKDGLKMKIFAKIITDNMKTREEAIIWMHFLQNLQAMVK